MVRSQYALFTLIIICLFVRPYPSYAYSPFHVTYSAYCPGNNGGKTSWHDYISGRFPWQPGRRTGIFGVQFRYAKIVGDRSALGTIDPAACYSVFYNLKPNGSDPKGFGSSRAYSYDRMGRPEYKDNRIMHGLPGDPEQNEINVDGVTFQYNEAGEVYDTKGQKVGQLVCYMSNECEQYHY